MLWAWPTFLTYFHHSSTLNCDWQISLLLVQRIVLNVQALFSLMLYNENSGTRDSWISGFTVIFGQFFNHLTQFFPVHNGKDNANFPRLWDLREYENGSLVGRHTNVISETPPPSQLQLNPPSTVGMLLLQDSVEMPFSLIFPPTSKTIVFLALL